MNKSIWLWVLLLLGWIIFASFIWRNYFCGNTENTPETTQQIIPSSTENGLSSWVYGDGTKHNTEINEHFRFNRSGFNHLDPVSADFSSAIGKTVGYLKSHPDRSLIITGYYDEGEENNSILPNLGLARANDISKFLIAQGVPAAQLINKAALLSNDWFGADILKKGIDFSFASSSASTSDERLSEIKDRLIGTPITLYFETNQKQLNLSAEQRTDFADIIHYLDHVATSKLEVSGHTDNVGDNRYNYRLSRKRAEFVSDYLHRNGNIDLARINATGVGPDSPIGDNDLAEGRAKNRRVEVTLN